MKTFFPKNINFVVFVLFLFASTALSQSDLLKNDLDRSFKKFDLVRINTQQAISDFQSNRVLKLNTSEKSFELILQPNDLRSKRFRAEDTILGRLRQIPRAKSTTYKGFIRGEANSKVRLSLDKENIEGYLISEGTRFFIESAKNYSKNAKQTDFIIYRTQDYLGKDDFDCHSDLMRKIQSGSDFISAKRVSSLTGKGVLEIATEADFEFVTELGGANEANAEILKILNMVEGVFDEQLNLKLQVVYQHTWSEGDPLVGATPQALTNSFKTYWNTNFPVDEYPRDTAHLFSSKSGVVSQGFAFIGPVCDNPPFAYGISGRISWAPGKYLLTGHEIGHNVGGHHVGATQNCENTIMSPTLSGSTPLVFCEFSQNEIGNFVDTNGGCLEAPNESSTRFDFDGDNKTDAAIYRPRLGQWWYLRSTDGDGRAATFGTETDKMVPADYTGDGLTDIAFWREATGELFVLRSEDGSFYSFPFGTAGDIPAPGDFDADGIADFAVFRPSTSSWFILKSTGGVDIRAFGTQGDIPVVEDYDGDGSADLAIFRPGVFQWWINRSTDGVLAIQFGTDGDLPAPADFTGDGKTDIAFWRPTSGEWFVVRSEDQSFFSAPFGTNRDVPVPGDYDGDGTADFAVWRPNDKTWYVLGSQSGFFAVPFGSDGDIPVPASYIP